jgi:hypothetical protein
MIQSRRRRRAYTILMGKPEGNKPIKKPTLRWKDKIVTRFDPFLGGILSPCLTWQ